MTEARTFIVTTPMETLDVTASLDEPFRIRDGCLVFLDGMGNPSMAFAPGSWLSVVPVENEPSKPPQ